MWTMILASQEVKPYKFNTGTKLIPGSSPSALSSTFLNITILSFCILFNLNLCHDTQTFQPLHLPLSSSAVTFLPSHCSSLCLFFSPFSLSHSHSFVTLRPSQKFICNQGVCLRWLEGNGGDTKKRGGVLVLQACHCLWVEWVPGDFSPTESNLHTPAR